jgi:hypothetical protein
MRFARCSDVPPQRATQPSSRPSSTGCACIWQLVQSESAKFNSLLTIVGLFASFIVFFVAPDKATLPMSWVLLFGCLAFLLICVLVRAAYEAHHDSAVYLPKVLMAIDAPPTYANAAAVLLLEPTQLLGYDSMVSLYFLQDGVERFCGVGRVANIQADKKVQVVLLKDDTYAGFITTLKANKPDDLRRLLVKASVPSNYLVAN